MELPSLRKLGLVQAMKPRRENLPPPFIDLSREFNSNTENSVIPDSSGLGKGRRSITGRDKKPYKNDTERERELRSDAWIKVVEPRRVLCKHCRTWVKLRNTTKYCPTPWYIHKEKCLKKTPTELVEWAFRTNKTIVSLAEYGSDDDKHSDKRYYKGDSIISRDEEEFSHTGSDDSDSDTQPRTPSSPYFIKREPLEEAISQSHQRVNLPIYRCPTPPWQRSNVSYTRTSGGSPGRDAYN